MLNHVEAEELHAVSVESGDRDQEHGRHPGEPEDGTADGPADPAATKIYDTRPVEQEQDQADQRQYGNRLRMPGEHAFQRWWRAGHPHLSHQVIRSNHGG